MDTGTVNGMDSGMDIVGMEIVGMVENILVQNGKGGEGVNNGNDIEKKENDERILEIEKARKFVPVRRSRMLEVIPSTSSIIPHLRDMDTPIESVENVLTEIEGKK